MIAIATYSFNIHGIDIQRGVAAYALERNNARWRDLVAIPVPMMDARRLPEYAIEGLIVAVPDLEVEQQVRRMGIPAVNISNSLPNIRLHSVVVDDVQCGELAARYYLERGYQHFGYVIGENLKRFVSARGEGFAAVVKQVGGSVSWYGNWPDPLPPGAKRAKGDMTNWILSLPKPVALFASNDRAAAELHSVALAARLSVPEQVSILGVDNEPNAHYLLTGISSIQIPVFEVGRRAAEMLDELMSGKTPSQQTVRLPPGEVITRTSSDTRAIGDSHVLDALLYIRTHATQSIEVDDVVAKGFLSRRSLERRFRAATGTTLKDEIARVRIACARTLLTTTNMSVEEIARASGYRTRSQFFAAFRTLTGLVPSQFRAQNTV